MMHRKNYILFLLLAWSSLLTAQISIEAQASKTEVEVGERFRVSFVVSLQGQTTNIEPMEYPDFKGFEVVGKSAGQNMQYVNGNMSKQWVETFTLVATEKGKYTLSPAQLKWEDKVYKTKPITIVVKENSAPENNENVKGNGLVFMDLIISEPTAYPNQQVTATVKLYAKSFDALRRRSDVEIPPIEHLQIQKIDIPASQRSYSQETVGNQVYITEEIAKYLLIPQKEGTLEIPSFRARVAIPIDFFDERVVLVKTPVQNLNVKSLPPNPPANFKGAIGDFKLLVNADKEQLNANQALHVDVELIGEGNLSNLSLPKISVDENIETYPPKNRRKIIQTQEGEKGKIADEYVLVPQYGGEYEIPSLQFTYLDPKNAEYKTISSPAIPIVVEGPAKPVAIAQDTATKDSADNQNAGSILPKKNQPNKTPKDSIEKTNGTWLKDLPIAGNDGPEDEKESTPWAWYIAIPSLLAAGVFGGIKWWNANKNTAAPTNTAAVDKKALKNELSLLSTEMAAENKTAYLKQSKKLLDCMVAYVAQQQATDYTTEVGRKILSEKTSESFAHQWENTLNETQLFAYGNASADGAYEAHFQQHKKLVDDLLKYKV